VTEAEWLTCEDPYNIAFFLNDYRPFRKFRQLAFACLHTVEGAVRAAGLAQYLEVIGRLAEGCETQVNLEAAVDTLRDLEAKGHEADDLINALRLALYDEVEPTMEPSGLLTGPPVAVASAIDQLISSSRYRWETENGSYYGSLARCIFGNPFRPVAFNPAWRTDTAIALARQMYDSRDFGAMPILADALQDAGCEDEQVLNHCRDAGPHARGCWVVDGVLGKA
jgi:hypothetical protein